ncbi:hypothetical protein PR202_ga17273 [Eleusine coracana subsp. coracana]|uniref:RING-type E3 ubiquitin transferase n=1 Tax=Eleusine coracana subsp. coracana TaxID=191504 RepID=A0AAV5CQC6_ELECO|nr:hypothetical protein QOZ80_6AG0516160 [Eleusine coracana subsp. coracana]GJN00112.1 hypothetical protein PR202_ga17273 [Eleusine coracana subsp. coracana]
MDELSLFNYVALTALAIFFAGVLIITFVVILCTMCKEADERLERRAAAPSPPPPPLQLDVVLPYFPYAGRGDGSASEAAACAICLGSLRQGQLCSEVPACRHALHKDCLGMWAKTKGSCPLCRAKIGVQGSDGVV